MKIRTLKLKGRLWTDTLAALEQFFKEDIARHLRHLELNFINWVSGHELAQVISCLHHLQVLIVHNTNIKLHDLDLVFQTCQNLTELSFSLENELCCRGLDFPFQFGFQRLKKLKLAHHKSHICCQCKWALMSDIFR